MIELRELRGMRSSASRSPIEYQAPGSIANINLSIRRWPTLRVRLCGDAFCFASNRALARVARSLFFRAVIFAQRLRIRASSCGVRGPHTTLRLNHARYSMSHQPGSVIVNRRMDFFKRFAKSSGAPRLDFQIPRVWDEFSNSTSLFSSPPQSTTSVSTVVSTYMVVDTVDRIGRISVDGS